jgi:hypothetical protein
MRNKHRGILAHAGIPNVQATEEAAESDELEESTEVS